MLLALLNSLTKKVFNLTDHYTSVPYALNLHASDMLLALSCNFAEAIAAQSSRNETRIVAWTRKPLIWCQVLDCSHMARHFG